MVSADLFWQELIGTYIRLHSTSWNIGYIISNFMKLQNDERITKEDEGDVKISWITYLSS